jgi:hypothetical protein
MTEDVVVWWSERTGMELKPFFAEYLQHAAIPKLELRFDAAKGVVSYRWKADEAGFAMPIAVGLPEHWTLVKPVANEWKTMTWMGSKAEFEVATDLYYVDVSKE